MVTTVGKRTYQPHQKTEQRDIWYTPLPVDVMWAIYARQSTPAQVLNNTESTEMQTDDLIRWLVDRQIPETRIFLFDADLGVSGTLRIDQRTGLQELVERIKRDEIKAVLVYQVSRLFRDETGVQYNVFATICKQHNCLLVTADGTIFNFNNPMHVKMFRYLAEMAAEFIPQQIGLLNAAKIRKARKGLYAGLGALPSGLIVDRLKASPSYGKLIPYELHAKVIFRLFERFFALGGNFYLLCREVDTLPVLFPPFDTTVDSRTVAMCRRKKVPGGTHITRDGLLSILTNPVYIGWWIVQGDIINRNNHEPIFDQEHEYLFWYAFDRLSDYSTEGKINEKRVKRQPRRFLHKATTLPSALLKDRITTPNGQAYAHITRSQCSYLLSFTPSKVLDKPDAEMEARLIDEAFKQRFFERLGETHEFEIYKRWIAEETKKQSSILSTVSDQLAEIELQQEDILSDRLGLRRQINAIKNKQEKIRAEQHAQPTFERLLKRSAKLDETKAALLKKQDNAVHNETLDEARKFADFQTELKKLIPVWEKKPIAVRREFVNLFVSEAALTIRTPHFVQLAIHWAHPAWGIDTLSIFRKTGARPSWSKREREILRTYYPDTPPETILKFLPNKSWGSIKQEAVLLNLSRKIKIHLPIPMMFSLSDWQFMQEQGISLKDLRPKCVSSPPSSFHVPRQSPLS